MPQLRDGWSRETPGGYTLTTRAVRPRGVGKDHGRCVPSARETEKNIFGESMEVFHVAADLIGLAPRVRLELEEPRLRAHLLHHDPARRSPGAVAGVGPDRPRTAGAVADREGRPGALLGERWYCASMRCATAPWHNRGTACCASGIVCIAIAPGRFVRFQGVPRATQSGARAIQGWHSLSQGGVR